MVKQGISACIMIKDEEKNLAELLPNLRGVVDEIIAGDHESSDKSVEILKKAGAKVLNLPDPYKTNAVNDSERDILNQNASFEWILHIDADERLTERTRKELPEMAARKDYDVVWLLSKHFYAPGKWFKHGFYRPHHEPRFYKRSCKTNWNVKIHEPPRIGGKHLYSDLDYDHLYFTAGAERIRKKHEIYIKNEREQKKRYLSNNPLVKWLFILFGYPVYLFNGLIRYSGFLDGWVGIKTASFLAWYFARSGYLEILVKKKLRLIKYSPYVEKPEG